MPAGMESFKNGVRTFTTTTNTSRVLGSRVVTANTLERLTVPIAPGKKLWWSILVTGDLSVFCYRATYVNSSLNQAENQFTIQADGATWSQGQTGTAYVFYGEHGAGVVQGGGGQAPDLDADPISLSHISASTNNPSISGQERTFQITGINQPFAFEVERYNNSTSGNLSVNRTFVRTGPSSSGPWTEQAMFAANALKQFAVENGTWVQVAIEAQTTSSTASTNYWLKFRNATQGADMGSMNVALTVDADNNYGNADPHLDSIDWGNLSGSVTADDIAVSNAYKTLSGINQTVNLRATISGYSGNLSAGSRVEMWVGGALRYHSTNIANGSWAGGNFNPGEQLAFVIYGRTDTPGQPRSGSFTVTVQNLTTGATVDTFNVSISVAGDDYSPNPLGWGNVTYATNDAAIWNGPAGQVTGINRTVTLRVERYSFTGWIDALAIHVYRDYGAGWVHIGSFDPRNGGYQYVDVAVNPGDSIHYAIQGSTNGGRQQADFNMVVWNLSQSGQQIANHNVTVVVDADNNYWPADPNPDSLNLSNLSISTNDYIGAASQTRTITGINTPITIRATISNVSGNVSWGGAYVQKSGSTIGAYIPWVQGGESREATFVNGDQINFYYDASTTSGRRTGQFYTELTNVTTNQSLGGFWTYCDVDADNNYNVVGPPVVSISPTYLDPGHQFSPSGRNITVSAGSSYASVSGGQAPFSYAWERVAGSSAWTINQASDGSADFAFFGRTNFTASGSFRLKVTDAQNRVAYSDVVDCFVTAGNVET